MTSEWLEIPWRELSADALRGVIEEFVSRDGTDYGEVEIAFEIKVEQVQRQLERGDIRIVFDPETEGVTLVEARLLTAGSAAGRHG